MKSLIIEAGGEKLHVLLPGDRKLSESKLGLEYRMLPPEKSRELTGFESGAVHPFSSELKHIVDERVFENKQVSHTTGEKDEGVIIDSENFREALNKSDFEAESRDIAVSKKEDFLELEEKGLSENEAKFVANNGFRKDFLQLRKEYDAENILNLLKAFNRNNLEVRNSETILQRAISPTHIQRMVESLSDNGELPKEKEIDLNEKIEEIIQNNPEAVQEYHEGQDSALNFLLGQLMKETNGKAQAKKAKKKLVEELE